MTTRPDPSAPEALQKATGGPQGGLEGASGQREAPRGESDPQAGAESLGGDQQPRGPVDWARRQAAERQTQASGDLQQQIASTIRDTPARYPDDIAAAVWRVIEKHLDIRDAEAWCKTCRRVWEGPRHQCESDTERRLARIRTLAADLFVAGATGAERAVGRRLLNALAEPEPTHYAGPSIREAADADRRWPLEKHGE